MNILKKNFYKKKVLITGHTGFKGSWLTCWLLKYKANIVNVKTKIAATKAKLSIQKTRCESIRSRQKNHRPKST